MSASSGLTVADASVAQSACYIGVSPSLFDKMGADGRMPQRINSRTVWDSATLDEAFEALPDGHECNLWDDAPT